MTRPRPLVLLLVLGSVTPPLWATPPASFDRYQIIIDRTPFGTVASTHGGEVALPGFADRYVFVGVVPDVDTPRLMAIIQDKSTNRVELRGAGEMLEDVKVVRIDPDGENSRLVLQRGLEVAPLKYQPRGATPVPGGVPPPGLPPGVAMAVPPPVPPPGGAEIKPVQMPRRVPFRRGNSE